jgi:tetratricopeptide (TPR) repeat protein
MGGLLHHIHLVEVYALEQVDTVWVCAMESVDGPLLDRAPLSPRSIVDVGQQACAALSHAHESLGAVHGELQVRDLVHSRGVLKVAGFGMPRVRAGKRAPEVVSGSQPDARSDVWGLGTALKRLAGDIDGALRDVLARSVEADPAMRYATAAALSAALDGVDAAGESLVQCLGRPARSTAAGAPAGPGGIGDDPRTLVGRAQELAALQGELETPGLITLRGLPGVGKSRLAREAARSWHGGTASLAVSSADVVGGTAAALNLSTSSARAVGDAIRARGPLLLLLDDLDRATDMTDVVQWLRAAPELRVLATAHAPLGVPGERTLAIGPLDEASSVALLQQAATKHHSAEALRPLVAHLDGLPLALELAAGRLGVLSPGQIASRLERRFSVLSDRRGRGLAGALAVGFDLLAPEEQEALCQLTSFAGSFGLVAADSVVAVDGVAIDVIEQLIDRGWLQVRMGRLSLLHSVRSFAAARPDREATFEGAERRHGAWFAALGSKHERRIRPSDLASVVLHVADIRVANLRALARGDGDVAVGTAVALARILWRFGRLELARDAMQRTLELPDLSWNAVGRLSLMLANIAPDPTLHTMHARAALEAFDACDDAAGRRTAIMALGVGLGRARPPAGALDALSAALEHARAAGDEEIERAVLSNLAVLLEELGRTEEALDTYDRAIRLHLAAGDLLEAAQVSANACGAYTRLGRFDDALQRSDSALVLIEGISAPVVESAVWFMRGKLFSRSGRLDDAETCMHRALQRARHGGVPGRVVESLRGLGLLALSRGQTDKARDLYDQAIAVGPEASLQDEEALGMIDYYQARYRDAATRFAAVRQAQLAAGLDQEATRTRLNQGLALIRAGDLADARLQLTGGLRENQAFGAVVLERGAELALARLSLLEGNREDAEHHLARATEGPERAVLAVWLLVLQGEHAEARARLAALPPSNDLDINTDLAAVTGLLNANLPSPNANH